MKRTIQTKALQRWKLIDRLAWLIPVLIAVWMIKRGMFSTFGEVVGKDASARTAGAYILIAALTSLIFSAPLVFLWRAVSHQVRKGLLQRTTIPLVQELDYYRDKLDGLSPTVISMLVDLQIEPQKDAAALILKYELMGVVSTEGGGIAVKNPNHPGLQPSDKALLELLEREGGAAMQGAVLANLNWLSLAKQEAAQTPYFQRAKPSAGCFVTGCLLPFLFFIAVMALLWFSMEGGWYQYFLEKLKTASDDTILVQMFQSDPVFRRELISFLLVALLVFVALFQPLISIPRALIKGYNLSKSGLKRTRAGEETAECIYGMKNFLHDFSNLSEADQEHLALWDDFLIYAVVLEENERIVDQIKRRRNPRSSF